MSDNDDKSFGEAINELEKILSGIEDESIDIDTLASELQRATGLLESARSKLRRAELEVRQVVDRMQSEETDSSAD